MAACATFPLPENSALNRKWGSERTLLIGEPALNNQPRVVTTRHLSRRLTSLQVGRVIPRLRAANLSPFCNKLTTGAIKVTRPLGREFIETLWEMAEFAAFQMAPIRFLHLRLLLHKQLQLK